MKIVIQSLDVMVAPELELLISTNLQKLLRYPISIIRAEVILGEDAADSVRRKFCNMRLITPRNGYIVSHYKGEFEDAVLTAVAELDARIRKDVGESIGNNRS